MKLMMLHTEQRPFSVIVSDEFDNIVHSLVYHNTYGGISMATMNTFDIDYFGRIKHKLKRVIQCSDGEVYEFGNFKGKTKTLVRKVFLDKLNDEHIDKSPVKLNSKSELSEDKKKMIRRMLAYGWSKTEISIEIFGMVNSTTLRTIRNEAKKH